MAVDEDPLAMLTGGSPVAAGFDPLSAPSKAVEAVAPASAALSAKASDYSGGERGGSGVPKLAWDGVKRTILKEFHVEGALNFGAGFGGEGEFDESGGSAGKTVDLRAKKRLQQLEKDAGVVHGGVEMSQVIAPSLCRLASILFFPFKCTRNSQIDISLSSSPSLNVSTGKFIFCRSRVYLNYLYVHTFLHLHVG